MIRLFNGTRLSEKSGKGQVNRAERYRRPSKLDGPLWEITVVSNHRTMPKHRERQLPGVEGLESRQLLAGNVIAGTVYR